MSARDCTQLLGAVQHGVFAPSKYLRSICTSVHALWRPDGLSHLIAESCLAKDSTLAESNPRGDSGTSCQTLAHMLLEGVVWITEMIVPGTGQEES
jgi:hypothetical protein